jgi:hypothetical protein
MPTYFFHLRDGEDLMLDMDGRELDGLDAVKKLALIEARAILAEEVRGGRLLLDKHIDVENAYGGLVHRLAFADAIEIVPPNG